MLKFVYFDVGGVILFDFSKSNKFDDLRKELGISKKKEKEFMLFWRQYEIEICTSFKMGTVVDKLEKKFGIKLPKDYSLFTDGFISRFELNRSIWPVLSYVKNYFKIGLLTNQYIGMFERVKKANLLPSIDWDVVIDSSIIGLAKPDPNIFKQGEKLAKAKGSEILFVENTQKHIEAAKKFNWNTFLYDPANPKESNKKLLKFIKRLNDSGL